MHHNRTTRTISDLQSQYLGRKNKSEADKLRPHTCGRIFKLCTGDWRPKTCQYIDGEPSKQQLRKYGSEPFQCGAAIQEDSPYCARHHARCYTKPLTSGEPKAVSSHGVVAMDHKP